ncbi:MAG TPA: glycosyl transferase family 2 [Sphingobacterium sp.]|nr:Alpha-L-Rha alpha-1,3-L-rhamnosyltransferase [Sphingobacterium faecium PCAi_F2.5]HCU44893.1 glycosyl transferase family 2 [Sphingobacterium sp.]
MKVIVKVLLGTYNGERYICEQIHSIKEQEKVEVDLLISDDGSKDSTKTVIKREYPQIPVFVNNPGTGSAANNFLNMVKNLDFDEKFEYVALSDQDDIWLPNKINAAIEIILKDSCDLYCSNLTKWDTSNASYSLLKKDYSQKKFDYLFEGGSAGCTYVFKRSFAKSLQKFINQLDLSNWRELSHDWIIYFFARSNKFKVVIDKNSYIYYRLHSSNVHGHLNKLSWNTIREKSLKVLNGYYQEHAQNYIKYLDRESESYHIYKRFLGNYFQRNIIIWKYNTQLMRDYKKFLIFAALNLLKFK